jgi:hypothetical protein
MWETLGGILKSEFLWGIIIGAFLTGIGSILVVRLQGRDQQRQRAELVRTFSIDTVQNIVQIIRDLQNLRSRTNAIQHDFLALLQIELDVFGRNREQIIHLPPDTRAALRQFMNSCAIKRAEISNFLTDFYQQSGLANQLAQQSQQQAHTTTLQPSGALANASAAAARALTSANAAADQLYQLKPDGDEVLVLLKARD